VAASLVAFATYAAVFALIAWPWLSVAASSLPTPSRVGRADARLLTWILWWVSTALTGSPGSLFDAPINYPAANQLTGSEHFIALQVIFLPLHRLTDNPVLTLNLILFLSYPAAALLMNRLLLALGFASGVAWVVGLLFALSGLQAPTSVYFLHALAAFVPATALALHRLREDPRASNVALLALVLVTGFCTAYYTAAILLVVVLVFGLAEAVRPLAGRRRFVLRAAAVLAGCFLVLAVLSVPYLERAWPQLRSSVQSLALDDVLHGLVLIRPLVQTFGAVTLVLAAAGVAAAALGARPRWLVLTAFALVASGVFLGNGGALALVNALPETTPYLLRLPAQFFRIVPRFALVTSFGFALLAAIALQQAMRVLPSRAGVALLAVVALAVAVERGGIIYRQPLDASLALSSDLDVYREVGRIVRTEGEGPLLEVPITSFGYSLQAEAMLGAMAHRQPLITGHTGYPPPHRDQLDDAIRRLPTEQALQEIVDMTHVRWLLIRPREYWSPARARRDYVDALLRMPGVTHLWQLRGWTLAVVERQPQQAAIFDAIAAGHGTAAPRPIAQPPAPSDGKARDAT